MTADALAELIQTELPAACSSRWNDHALTVAMIHRNILQALADPTTLATLR